MKNYVNNIEEKLFSSCQYSNEIKKIAEYLNNEKHKCFGIQINQDVDDCSDFSPLLSHNLNNLGDPFTGKGGHLVTFNYERELVELVAGYFNIDSSEVWGYYNPGSTYSNLHGVHLGMSKFENPTLIISDEAHNSFVKAARITRCKAVVKIKTDQFGRMCPEDFEKQLRINRTNNYIISFCSGSVTKGAYDDAETLLSVLRNLGIDKSQYYLHLDAALGGMITPFLLENPLRLDFSIDEIDSLSVSFHKRLGIPMPGSLFLARKKTLNTLPDHPYAEHYSSYDTTLGGSRDGFSPFVTLMKLKKIGYEGMVSRTNHVLEKAKWLCELLRNNDINASCNDYSPCVVLPAPSSALLKEYHLPLYASPEGDYTHIFTMEHVKKNAIYTFLDKYLQSNSSNRVGPT